MTVEEIHGVAVSRAKARVDADLSFLEILEVVDRQQVYLHKGYSSLWSYCHVGLGMTESDTARYLKVLRTGKKFPELKKVVLDGTVSLPKAARVAELLTPDNQSEWIEKAKSLTTRKLDVAVVSANPKAIPREKITPRADDVFELKTKISQKTLDQLQQLKDLVSQKLRRPATTDEALLFAFEETLKKHDPVRRAERNIDKSLSTLKVIPQGRVRHSAAVRHQIFLRDRNQCTALLPNGSRCLEKRHIDMHHVIERCQGGTNHPDNLTLLCNGHHRAHHRTSQRNRLNNSPSRTAWPKPVDSTSDTPRRQEDGGRRLERNQPPRPQNRGVGLLF